ncbi:ABC transporter substrate-binding protein [Cryobacterium levicorallinum]|uniref:ABC transporter substrate-binding protein n=1 Tax=Cryobacterium levicorallinum TaxID=995038 RepID=A0A1I3BC96_9MICO|nr:MULTISPECIES: ABC transporter substrate-binding protein [Cryobacterium]TFB88934.1 ABC transporter substrate-binding protein [Cryobacterium levicorallinum]GEP28110.1 peptide ABC transporter [Cryobacterium levicorallinum]SFH59770.1 peptide/nickel transport system substrate-binding protein [Cryobacterium levicorallinum]
MRIRAHSTSWLRAAAAVLATVALVTGCTATTPTTAADANTLTYAINGGTLSGGKMDIHSSAFQATALVMRNSFDSLVYEKADGSFVPWLATSWQISDDGLHYTFDLRGDVTFHDGEPFNAEAVKANFEHVVAPETASADAASLIGYAETGGFYAGTEVVDEFTVRVNFSQPYAPFLQAVSTAKLGFYSPATLRDNAAQLPAGGPGISVGTGPYVLSEYTPDQGIVFTANEDYDWAPEGSSHQGAPAIDTLEFRILPESSVRTGALTSGQAQIASDITPNTVSQIGDDFSIENVTMPGLPYTLFLNEAHGVFADENVRRAFALGVDIGPAVETIYQGQAERAWSILSPATPNSYDPSLEDSWAFDPDQANALLDASGWTERDSEGYRTKGGARLSAQWLAYTPVSDANASLGDVVQSDLRDIGFEIVRDNREIAQYYEAFDARDYDLSDWSFPSVDADVLRAHLHSGGYKNGSSTADPVVDQLLDDAIATSDPTEREALYQQLQKWNATHVVMVPITVPTAITAYSKTIENLSFDLYGQPLFYEAALTTAP